MCACSPGKGGPGGGQNHGVTQLIAFASKTAASENELAAVKYGRTADEFREGVVMSKDGRRLQAGYTCWLVLST